MAQLPQIDYGTPVQSTTQLAGAPMEAASGLSKAISDGLAAYSQALIQSQVTNAHNKTTDDLNTAARILKEKKYFTAQEVRDTLDGQVPPELEEKIQQVDPNTGQKVDKQQIPNWAVGDVLYAHAAKKIVENQTGSIDGPGWKTFFKEGVAPTVNTAKQAVATYHLEALDRYLQTDTLTNIDRAVNQGNFKKATELAWNRTLPAETQVKAAAMVETAKQEYDANQALAGSDPGTMKSEAERLRSSPDALKFIEPAKRKTMIVELENRARIFESDGIAKAVASNPKNLNPDGTVNRAAALAELDRRPDTSSDPILKAHALEQVDRRATIAAAGRDDRTNTIAARAMQAFTMVDPTTGRPNNSITAVQLMAPKAWEYLSSPASGIKGAEIKRTLEAWDREDKARIRGERMQPTPAQAARAIAVEAWIYGSPAEVKATPVSAFSDQWMSVDPASGEAQLSQADYQRLGNLFAQVKGRPLDQFYIENPKAVLVDEMKEAYPHLRVPEAKWTQLETKVYNAVSAKLEKRFAGTKPSPEDIRTFVKSQLAAVKVKGWLGETELPAIQAEVQGRVPLGRTGASAATPTPAWNPPKQAAQFYIKAPNGEIKPVPPGHPWLTAPPSGYQVVPAP